MELDSLILPKVSDWAEAEAQATSMAANATDFVLLVGMAGFQRANSELRSAKDFISIALPEGSRKNIVACSPGSPLKRT